LAIHPATDSDRDAIWAILEQMIRSGETYTLPRDMSKQAALEYWFAADKETFVWKENGQVSGTYFLKANQQGGGAHVANKSDFNTRVHDALSRFLFEETRRRPMVLPVSVEV